MEPAAYDRSVAEADYSAAKLAVLMETPVTDPGAPDGVVVHDRVTKLASGRYEKNPAAGQQGAFSNAVRATTVPYGDRRVPADEFAEKELAWAREQGLDVTEDSAAEALARTGLSEPVRYDPLQGEAHLDKELKAGLFLERKGSNYAATVRRLARVAMAGVDYVHSAAVDAALACTTPGPGGQRSLAEAARTRARGRAQQARMDAGSNAPSTKKPEKEFE